MHLIGLYRRIREVFPKAESMIPVGRVLDGAAMIMRAIAENGATAAAPMREVALSEGAILSHLLAGFTAKVSFLPNTTHQPSHAQSAIPVCF